MQQFQYWVRWMHGSYVHFSCKEAGILLMTYTMLQILTGNWLSFYLFIYFPVNNVESWLDMVNTETLWFGVNSLVPAGDTEFAKDASFGYKSSNLREV